MSQCVGVVLAGGDGERMGRPKGDLVVGTTTLAERAATILWPLCSSVLVSVSAGASNPAPRCPIVEDEPPAGRGPLAGIDAAYRATGEADLLVLACDYPNVGEGLLRRLLAHAAADDDLVMLRDPGGRDHPLVARWSRRAEPRVRDALERRIHKVRTLLPDLRVRRLGPAELPGVDLARALVNVNWPADLAGLSG